MLLPPFAASDAPVCRALAAVGVATGTAAAAAAAAAAAWLCMCLLHLLLLGIARRREALWMFLSFSINDIPGHFSARRSS